MFLRQIGSVVLLGATLLASGCIAVAAGAAAGYAGYEYTNGECMGVAGATVDATYHATLKMAEQLQMTVKTKAREISKADLSLRRADGTPVEITLARQNTDFTRITVRVGTFGDEAASRQIIAKIKENL